MKTIPLKLDNNVGSTLRWAPPVWSYTPVGPSRMEHSPLEQEVAASPTPRDRLKSLGWDHCSGVAGHLYQGSRLATVAG